MENAASHADAELPHAPAIPRDTDPPGGAARYSGRVVMAVILLVIGVFWVSLHATPHSEPLVQSEPGNVWVRQRFLALGLLCFGAAAWGLWPPVGHVERRVRAATPWRERLAVLAIVVAVVGSAVNDLVPSGFDKLFLFGTTALMLLLLPGWLRNVLPLSMRAQWLPATIATGVLVAAGLVFASGVHHAAEESAFPTRWIVGALLLAPIGEELLFRGALWHACRMLLPDQATLLVTAAVFTFAHRWLDWSGDDVTPIAAIAFFGLMLGWLRRRTGSLVPGMLAHALANALPHLLGSWGF